MKTRLLLVSVAVSGLCFGAGFANADDSLKLFDAVDVIPFNTLHTHLSAALNLSPHQVSENQKSLLKVAQVCWIMDTGDCAGMDFVGSDIDSPSGSGQPNDYVPKGAEDCVKEGYKLTSCPDNYKPNKYCLYDNRYFAECVLSCPDNYKKCEDPYYGVGEVCNGMYSDCQCDYCEGYDYTLDNIPAGYIADGKPCNSCNGPRYKIKINPCDGFLDCGDMGCKIGAETCLRGDKLLCSNCKPCPNLGTEDICPPCSVCTYEECSNKYYVTGCATGCQDYCSLPSPMPSCSSLGYTSTSCSQEGLKCPFDITKMFCL